MAFTEGYPPTSSTAVERAGKVLEAELVSEEEYQRLKERQHEAIERRPLYYHTYDEEQPGPQEVRFMRRDGWWLVSLLVVFFVVLPAVGMTYSGYGSEVGGFGLWLLVVAVHLVCATAVGTVVVNAVRRKWSWMRNSLIFLLASVVAVALVYILVI